MVDPEQEKYVLSKHLPIDDHIAAFERSLANNSTRYVQLTMNQVRRVVTGCQIEKLADINAETVQDFLRNLCVEDNLGHRTHNHYVQAVNAFCNWCVHTNRLIANPLKGLEKLNAEIDVRHPRRALTADEVGRLIESARSSGVRIQRYDGETRARIYTLSYMTGLRKAEIASLTPRSFDLDGVPPTVTVEARHSKHRKKDVLPLHPELVVMLREWLLNAPKSRLFPQLDRRKTWLMVKKDLERAGIPYQTEEGIADFHAAGRHTHITGLLRNGASWPEARKLARHSDIKTTMRYTHIGIEDQARAVAHLPAPKTNPKPPATTVPNQESALQMRCISGGVKGHAVAQPDSNPSDPKRKNPCQGKGFDAERHRLSSDGKIGATDDTRFLTSRCLRDCFGLPSRKPLLSTLIRSTPPAANAG